jgi:hypothetical protein
MTLVGLRYANIYFQFLFASFQKGLSKVLVGLAHRLQENCEVVQGSGCSCKWGGCYLC